MIKTNKLMHGLKVLERGTKTNFLAFYKKKYFFISFLSNTQSKRAYFRKIALFDRELLKLEINSIYWLWSYDLKCVGSIKAK